MSFRALAAIAVATASCLVASCAAHDGPLVGRAIVEIAEAPDDVSCIRIVASSHRTVERSFSVATGDATVFDLAGLPIGDVTFTAAAFDAACPMVGPSSVPTWLAEPTVVTLVRGAAVPVHLIMRRNGRAEATVDFEDEPDASAPAGDACSASAETCNALDDDCDAIVDEGVTVECHPDADDDTHGVPGTTTTQCRDESRAAYGFCPIGWAAVGTDCDDAAPAINPDAMELCNGVDDDCDGTVDDGDPGGGAACSTGLLGACAPGTTQCDAGAISCVQNAAPTAEVCNGVDDDCDGTVDEGACP